VTSDRDFKVTIFFEVEYRKKTLPVKDKVTIAQEETIRTIWNGSILVTLIDH